MYRWVALKQRSTTGTLIYRSWREKQKQQFLSWLHVLFIIMKLRWSTCSKTNKSVPQLIFMIITVILNINTQVSRMLLDMSTHHIQECVWFCFVLRNHSLVILKTQAPVHLLLHSKESIHNVRSSVKKSRIL